MTTVYSRAKDRGPGSRFPFFARIALVAWLLLVLTAFLFVPLGAPGGIDAAYRGVDGTAVFMTAVWALLVLAAGLAAAWLVGRGGRRKTLTRASVIARGLTVWAVVAVLSYLPTAAMISALSGMTGPQPESLWLALATVLLLSGFITAVAAFVIVAWTGLNRMGPR